MSDTPHCLWPGRARLGEGPLWSRELRRLLFVDILGSRLMSHDPVTGDTRSWPLDEACCWLAPHADGGFVAGLRTRLVRLHLDADGPRLGETLARPVADTPGHRLNDGKADPAGRLWFGIMDEHEQAASGRLLRLDARGLHRVDAPYTVTNGPAIGADGRTLYHTDSPARTIYAFTIDADGNLVDKRVYRRFAEADGYPDGMTLDAEGGLWVAHWDGGRVSRFLPDGRRDREIALPASRVTCCTFGGDDLGTLYITTAAVGCDDQPQAGALFAVRPGVTGLPACVVTA
ncbi:SMP-30/gluconolactonase/LRE family protein [Modicisalibacter tunisiensis]|uniref:SMP-30/gluconolactonase/LRE family protein n=1 Tax=Modicisalibacter tunisiensis TaxID=390637 RepID=A0ABS7WY31_9GAMM|nr:SMP-30/gluconolactonase/LRE family protein [Modicisalibacter tunisiensis]MBZ9566647.1 SMP-30/gluconolactonase/LRE family protein [Modicisalibacter tunisiensis]